MITKSFGELKTRLELNDTFADLVSQQHNAVRSVIEKNGIYIVDTKLIGSLHPLRQTRIQPRDNDQFDIDILVILGTFDQWVNSGGITPQTAMERVHSVVSDSNRYGAMGPQQDNPTVTFEYANRVKVELVPAYLDNIGHCPNGISHAPAGRGYWIPSASGGWELADYDYEAKYISLVNQETGGVFIPTAKMLKALKREQFPAMKSFYMETIAAHIIPEIMSAYQTRGIVATYPGLVRDFLHNLENYLGVAVCIPGSNSKPFTIDPLAELQIRDKLESLKEVSTAAVLEDNKIEQHKLWKHVFGDIFPSS